MSEFVFVFSFPDGDARWTQGFILVRAKEGPTSIGGESMYYLAPKCLYRGEYKRDSMWILSPKYVECAYELCFVCVTPPLLAWL